MCPDRYDAALAQLHNQRSHLTNTCLQSAPGDADGDGSGTRAAEEQGLIKLLSELPQVGESSLSVWCSSRIIAIILVTLGLQLKQRRLSNVPHIVMALFMALVAGYACDVCI